jgi:DNA-binding beta-propeller fold protein YncE
VLVLLVMLLACGDEDDPASGSDLGTPTEAAVTPATSSTAEEAATATASIAPETATIEATNSPSIHPQATPPPPPADVPEYGKLTAWDASWEGLGTIVFGPDGRLYVDDYIRKQLMIFDTDGNQWAPLAYAASLPGRDGVRNDFDIGADGRIYLLEQSGAARIQVYEPGRALVAAWGGTVGMEPESLFDARTITVAPDGHVFTTKPGGLLQKFTSDGEFVAAWDRAGDYLFPMEVYDMEAADGALYLAVSGFRDERNAILNFDFDGNLIAEPLVVGESDDEGRIVPWSLAIGPAGNLFIADVFRREIIILTPAGDELARWPLESTDERFPTVEIAVDDAGRVYVADDAQNAILVYEPE